MHVSRMYCGVLRLDTSRIHPRYMHRGKTNPPQRENSALPPSSGEVTSQQADSLLQVLTAAAQAAAVAAGIEWECIAISHRIGIASRQRRVCGTPPTPPDQKVHEHCQL